MLPCTVIEKICDGQLLTSKIRNEQGIVNNDRRNIQTFKTKELGNKTDSRFQHATPTSMNFADSELEKTSQLYGRRILVLDLRTDLQNEVISQYFHNCIL